MRKYLLVALAAAITAVAPTGVMAQQHGSTHQQQPGKPQPKPQANKPQSHGAQANRQQPNRAPAARPGPSKDQYGTWNSAWGAKPSAPPRHWTKKNDWYRHVRACKQRFGSYNARTDTYRIASGKSLLCKL